MIIEFKPGQLVVAQFAWDAESKYRLDVAEDFLYLGMYIKMYKYGTPYHNHLLILYGDRLICAYPQYTKLYEPEL